MRHALQIACGALTVVPVCLAAELYAAPQAPTFRATTELVVSTVSVKDKNGRPIEGLTAKDFIVTEDGAPQDIAFVDFEQIAGAATPAAQGAATAPAPATVAPAATSSNVAPVTSVQIAGERPGEIKYRNRRLLVLYFDITALPPADLLRAYSAAKRYITDMGPADVVAVMTFQGGGVRVTQDFTDDKAQLLETIDALIFGDDKDGDGIPDDQGTAFGQDDAEFNILNTDRQLSALQTAVTMLRPLAEQKSLVYFSSGLRLNGVDNQAQLRATTNAALKANVALFPVDARGLVAGAPLGDATRASPGGSGMFSGQTAGMMTAMFQRSQDTLYSLARDTGGKALFDYNDLSLGIRQAADAITSYYVIGYYSTHTAKDGKFRRVKVELGGTLAADLSYRQGYFADKEFAKFTAADKERQLEDALMLDNPVTDITIAMELNYFQLNSAEYFVPVAVKIPGSELTLARRRGAEHTVIDFIGEVKDDYGITVQNVRDYLDIKLSDETAGQLSAHPIQYETGFTLLPGKYVLKLLARDAETGRIGTYQAAFTIPNLNKELTRVPISTVVLASQRVPLGDALFSVKQRAAEAVDPLVFDGEKLVPSVTRVFSKRRDLYVFLQAYERSEPSMQPLLAFVSLYRNGTKALETPPLAVTSGMEPKSKAVPLRFSVSLDALAPGEYDCQVSVLEPGGQKATFWQAPIVVVP